MFICLFGKLCGRVLIGDIVCRLHIVQDEREVTPANSEVAAAVAASATTATSHGIEVAVEFKPVEHPVEPLDNDRPIQCPLPEPSILNVR